MRIVILGCGPKALAIYAKMRGLQDAGLRVPEIVILEQSSVAAHWQGEDRGDFGFTDGKQPLGTPPEKDIGYPYNSEYKECAPDIDAFLLKFSWPAYRIAQGSYADWMDRDRPPPHHCEWADYQDWVATKLQLKTSGDYVKGSLQKVAKKSDRWVLQYNLIDSPYADTVELECDGLVITGPGEPKRVKNQTSSESTGIMDGRTFWKAPNMSWLKGRVREKTKIAVIGAGETAASVVSALLNISDEDPWSIDVISRRGTLYSRGEGYHENRFFSDPTNWGTLSEPLRKELIERTDRGVLSIRAMQRISKSNIVNCKSGTVDGITVPGGVASIKGSANKVSVHLEGANPPEEYDCVIVALGFNALSFGQYFKENLEVLEPLASAKNRGLLTMMWGKPSAQDEHRKLQTDSAQRISEDLSVAGLAPKLYLPMLSGLTQGPGFPNLSCLGLLSDRVLRHFVRSMNVGKFER